MPLASTMSVGRLAATAAGPTTEYTDVIRQTIIGTGAAGVLDDLGGGAYRYTFASTLPADAAGTWAFGLEGYRTSPLPGGETARHGAVNPVSYVSLDGSPLTERRRVVDNAKCNACHEELAVHGDNRVGETQYCVTCHNPSATDVAQRPAGTPESIDFKVMIHKIHRGRHLPSVGEGTPYVVYGFGNTAHDYSGVGFPRQIDRCDTCHLEGTETPVSTAACTSCHDGAPAKAHAELQTTSSGVESCAVCHGPDRSLSADTVHAQ